MIRQVLLAVLAVLAGSAVLWRATDGLRAFTSEQARIVDVSRQPREIPDVPLQLSNGGTARLSDLRGRPVVVTFIYTRCTTLCPMLSARLVDLRDQLAEDTAGLDVHFVSISFDPDRDRQDELAGYAEQLGADADSWWVARPTSGLGQLLDTFGIVVIPDDQGGYIHNGGFHLIDRDGRLVSIYDEQDPAELIEALKRM